MPPATRKRRKLQHTLDGVIARQIQEVRDLQRPSMSQQQLADRLGVTQATVTRIETGARAITVAEIFEIAAALNVAPIYLLGGAFTMEKVPVTAKIKLEPNDVRQWVMGDKPLPGGDEAAYLDRNIPDAVARQRRESVRAVEEIRRRFGQGATLVPLEDRRVAEQGGPSIVIQWPAAEEEKS